MHESILHPHASITTTPTALTAAPRRRPTACHPPRVYKNYDPRAKIIRSVAEEVFSITGRDPLIEIALELERVARSDDYFVSRKLYPNVDFFSGLVYRAMGFPPAFFTVLFAVPRMAGYLAHWREALADPDTKIVRPQQDYRVRTDGGCRGTGGGSSGGLLGWWHGG